MSKKRRDRIEARAVVKDGYICVYGFYAVKKNGDYVALCPVQNNKAIRGTPKIFELVEVKK